MTVGVHTQSSEAATADWLPLVPTAGFPATIERVAGDPIQWATARRDDVASLLGQCGAILFRGFEIESIESFERFATALCGELYKDYGDLPREPDGMLTYRSTPYPADRRILFHNEGSHLARYPRRQLFHCLQPAQSGGETPLADCSAVYARLADDVRDEFERKGLRYVRTFVEGFDVSWQSFFGSSDRTAVEQLCRRDGATADWSLGTLQMTQQRPAVMTHPVTGARVFFNQIQLHHPSYFDDETRAGLVAAFGANLPRNVFFGDGTPIPPETLAAVNDAYAGSSVQFPWQRADVLLLDNVRIAHSRNPYVGPRRLLVAMADICDSNN